MVKDGRDDFIEMLMTRGRHITFVIRTTTACNLKCTYCYQHKMNPTYMTKDHVQLVKDKIKSRIELQRKKYDNDFDMKFVFVGGEVSLNKYNIDILHGINEALSEIGITNYKSFEVLTNCYNMDDNFLRFLDVCKNKISNRLEILVSMDFNRDLTNKNRISLSNDTYDRVIENVRKLSDIGYKIVCNSVITDNTIEYNPRDIYNDLINTFKNGDIHHDINANYEYSINGEFNEKLISFMKTMYKIQTERMIKELDNPNIGSSRLLLLSLHSISYLLCYKDRLFCDLENCYGIEAIDDKHIVTFNCHGYTFNKNKRVFGELERSDKPNNINYYNALVGKIKNYNCNKCDLSPFCRQKCVCYGTDDRECVSFNKTMAILTVKAYYDVITSDMFYDKFLRYIKTHSRTGVKEYESWRDNKEFWLNRISKFKEVFKKYEQIYNRI